MESKKTIYFSDENHDDFSGIKRKTIVVDKNFKYISKNPLFKSLAFVCHRLIMKPFAFVYMKIKFRHKVVGKKHLKNFKNGYFLYANHTLMAGDAFIPNLTSHKKTYMIVHADNVSQKGLKNFMVMNGAIPVPTHPSGMKSFLNAVETRAKSCPIVIYPEAHIWPYYTKIRPFQSGSFRYPIKFDRPVFCLTNTFVKTKFRKTPKVITYIDGPFEVDKNLPLKEQERALQELVANAMKQRAKNSNYEYFKYIKKENR